MKALDFQLLVKNWVETANPTTTEIVAVVHFLDYVQQIEENNKER